MSRIGKQPVVVPAGVTINVSTENVLSVKGPKGELSQQIDRDIKVEVKEGEVVLSRPTDQGQNPKVFLEGIDKQLIGQVAAKLRSLRKPEPYKGKGVKYAGEILRRKAGKSAGK
jgi:large subunit ribosomal protein L6